MLKMPQTTHRTRLKRSCVLYAIQILAVIVFVATAMAQIPQASQKAPSPATASIGGTVLCMGTNTPIDGADVELRRVEGTTDAPMPAALSQAFAQILLGPGPNGPTPPEQLAAEVKYAKTGENGKFLFTDLKAGKYRLVAARIGGAYFPAEYGQHDPHGRGINFPIAEGQSMGDAMLYMAPTVAISGRVLDADGEPMGHVSVMALEPQYLQGQRILNIAQLVHTDERGDYRLFWLAPGRYYVAARVEDTQKRSVLPATVPPGRNGPFTRAQVPVLTRRVLESGETIEETYALVYNGGALTADRARPVDVEAGTTFRGVDIPMGAALLVSHHIRGVVLGLEGRPAGGAAVIALPRESSPNAMMLRTTSDENGAFDLAGAVPGSYSIFATVSAPVAISPELAAAALRAGVELSSFNLGSATTGLGYVRVEMGNADVNIVTIPASPGILISGRIVIERNAASDPVPDLRAIRINVQRDPDMIGMPSAMMPLPRVSSPSAGNPPVQTMANGQPAANGAVSLLVGSGDFRVTVSGLPAGAYVKSIRIGASDILSDGLHVDGAIENPLEVIIGTDAGEISGAVLDQRLHSVPNAVVALTPDSPTLRQRPDLYKSASTDSNGKFRLQDVPPGIYRLFAWEYAPPDSWQDREFIERYQVSKTVIEVRDHGKEVAQLSVIPSR